MTPKQKYKLAVRSIVDPATFIIVGGFAGLEQATNEFSGYRQGAAGYGKRYGAGLADTDIGAMLGGAVLPVLFHQDPRYFYKGTGTKWHRTLYALSTAVIARGDNGKWQPAYAGVLGDFASGAISNLYYPASNRNGAELTIENGFLAVAGTGVGNLLQEFVLKKISSGIKAAWNAATLDSDLTIVPSARKTISVNRTLHPEAHSSAVLPDSRAFAEEGSQAFLLIGSGAESAEDLGLSLEGFGEGFAFAALDGFEHTGDGERGHRRNRVGQGASAGHELGGRHDFVDQAEAESLGSHRRSGRRASAAERRCGQ